MNRSAASFALLTLAALATAQSRFSNALTAAGNPDYAPLLAYGFDYSSTGASQTLSGSKSWTGLDSSYGTRTMTLQASASASAEYGRLRSGVSASLSNTYYNSDNAPYWNGTTTDDEGSADTFLVAGRVGFSDPLSFGGGAQASYKARYVFFVEGTASGEGVSANLRVTIGNNPFEYLDVDLSGGRVAQYWSTDAYTIGSSLNQMANVEFTTRFDATTYDYALADGSTVAGTANFTSTITLARIDVLDANGNLVQGIPIQGASNTIYATPEPGTMGALGLGTLLVLHRARRSRVE